MPFSREKKLWVLLASSAADGNNSMVPAMSGTSMGPCVALKATSTCCGCCLTSAVEMSLSKEEKPKVCREQIDILDYPSAFGDLSPIEGFKGPKKPSRRQVLRHLLHLVSNNCTLKDAADRVVSEILAKHPTETETAKSTRRLSKWLWGSNEKTYTVMNKSFQTSGPKDSKAREKYFEYFSVSKSESEQVDVCILFSFLNNVHYWKSSQGSCPFCVIQNSVVALIIVLKNLPA